MFLILHGDNTALSRSWLSQEISERQQKGAIIHRLEASQLSVLELESLMGNQMLFADSQVVIIELLHSLPKSKRKDALIDLLSKHTDDTGIILWEKKKLTAVQLKKFPQSTPKEAKLSSALFAWLDIWHTKDKKNSITALRKAIIQDGVEICHVMLTRQVRMLLQVKSGEKLKGHPFYIQKIEQQARAVTEPQLLTIHHSLTILDQTNKTGKLTTSLETALEKVVLQ